MRYNRSEIIMPNTIFHHNWSCDKTNTKDISLTNKRNILLILHSWSVNHFPILHRVRRYHFKILHRTAMFYTIFQYDWASEIGAMGQRHFARLGTGIRLSVVCCNNPLACCIPGQTVWRLLRKSRFYDFIAQPVGAPTILNAYISYETTLYATTR